MCSCRPLGIESGDTCTLWFMATHWLFLSLSLTFPSPYQLAASSWSELYQTFCLLPPFLAGAELLMIVKCKFLKCPEICLKKDQMTPRLHHCAVESKAESCQLLISVFLVNCPDDNDSKYFNERLDLPIEWFIYQYFLWSWLDTWRSPSYCQSRRSRRSLISSLSPPAWSSNTDRSVQHKSGKGYSPSNLSPPPQTQF